MKKRKFCIGYHVLGIVFTIIMASEYCAAEISIEKLFLEEKYEKVIAEADRRIDARSSGRDELYYLKGLSELKLGRFNDARRSFEYILSEYSRSKRVFEANLGIGDAYMIEGNSQRAIKIYEEMLEKYPKDDNISAVRQRIERRRGRAEPDNSRGIYIQAGCFKNRSNAEKLSMKLSDEGYKSHVEPSAGGLYRVKIGRYPSKEDARAAAARLKQKGYAAGICNGI